LNNATNAFERMGLYPYNPDCESWSGAINTLGLGNSNNNKGKVQYEAYVTLPQKELSAEEKKILLGDLNVDPETDMFGYIGVAITRAEQILKRWRVEIDEALREGEEYEDYANIYLPRAKTDAEKIALTMVHLKKIERGSLPKCPVAQSKEKRGEEITRTIIASTKITGPIEVVAYLPDDSLVEDSDNNSSNDSTTSKSVVGTAVKNGAKTWTVILPGKQLTVCDDDLMDPSRFLVCRSLSGDMNVHDKKKQSAKQKRARQSEKLQKEKAIREKAMEELRIFERKEFDNIVTIIRSGNEYRFEDFLGLVDRIRKPFTCFVEGHEVSITQDDSAIMMEQSVLKEITKNLFQGQKRVNSAGHEEQARKKQRQGNQTVHTEKGATGITALHQTERRDERQNQIALKKQVDGIKRELKQIETILTSLTVRKTRKPQSYWNADQSTSQADLCLFLRMFAPDCGLFTKRKNEQWKFVEENLLQVLSKASIDAKEEQFTRRCADLQGRLEQAEREDLQQEDNDDGQEDLELAGGVDGDQEEQDPPAEHA